MKGKTLVHITTVPQTLYFLSGQLNYMKQQGLNVYVISSPGERLKLISNQEGIQYKEVSMERNINIIKDFISLVKLLIVLFKIKPDIVHTHTPKASLLGMIASWILRVPVRIYHVHGLVLETSTGLKRKVLMVTERTTAFLATHVFCVSRSLQNQMIKHQLCEPDKTKVILNGTINGVDSRNKFKPNKKLSIEADGLRKKINFSEDDVVIGFVARFTKDKGIEDLYYVWTDIKKKYRNTKLLLVGDLDTRAPASMDIIERFKKDKRVHFTGRVENTPLFYSVMDILIHPSYREGFGQVILEASAMEVPVVAYDVTGCKDAVVQDETGTLVPWKDKKELTKSIEDYIKKPHLRKFHGSEGRRRVIQSFNPTDIWQQMCREYRVALEAKPNIKR